MRSTDLARSSSSKTSVAPVAFDEGMLVKCIMVISIREHRGIYKTGTFESPGS